MITIFLFILIHWYLSAFCQTFFLHRYASHRMFAMSDGWQKFFYALTFVTQGTSYLNPRTYALMHRMHHAYSDTEKDPHSPLFFRSPWLMMMNTLKVYLNIFSGKIPADPALDTHFPEWKAFDRWADGLWPRVAFGALYVWFYVSFATAPWQYVFLPIHFVIGPVHGAIVNWCGHRYGYANYDNRDESKNTFAVDLLTMGELMQNNHHRHGKSPNFAVKSSEWDPTYAIIRFFGRVGIVRL